MASAKKKTSAKKSSAKPSVKYAAKAQNTARQTSPSASWVNKGAADWQKGASDWAKESAKLYQMPFAQGDVNAAAQQAANTMKSATENMSKMGNEWMQQLFGQQAKATAAQAFNPQAMMQQLQQQFQQQFSHMPSMPQFDASSMQKKLADIVRESSEQLAKSSQGATRAAEEAAEVARENIEAAVEVSNVAVSVTKELMAEIIGYMNKQFTQNVELSKQALSCRTLNDMFDLSTRIMKCNLDAFFCESVKISEMLFQCATDVSEPLNERVSETTERMTKAMAA
jgi:hypothetical protein